MLAKERRNSILQLLHKNGAVTAAALTERFGVSLETVRRDLMCMEKEGLLSRVHGGAVEEGGMKLYPSLERRNEENSEEKQTLARTAAGFVREGDIIGIDAGSTAVFLAEALRDRCRRLTVVTHSLDVFSVLSDKRDFTVILCGGLFLKEEKAFCGSLALEMLDSLHMQKVFICPSAISLQHGIADYQTDLYEMQKKLQQCGDRVYILADSSKFEKRALLKLDEMRPEYEYITDGGLPEELHRLYTENNICIHTEKGDGKMKTKAGRYTILFMLTYMVSYITRINYGAVILAMEEATDLSGAALSMALTGSFITYGAGQLVSGWAGDRISPKKLIFFGLLLTTGMNLLIPVCSSHGAMLAVWCVNGFAQAFMWPPLVRLMTVLLSEEEYKKATVRVSWGSCLGTVIVYMAAPYLITLTGWKSVFLFSAVCGACMAAAWFFLCPEIAVRQRTVKTEKTEGGKLVTPMMLGIMTAVVLMGALRDGVTTWMPTYISETYSLGSAVSILTGAVLPLFSILCFQAASSLHRKKLRNPVFCAGFIFAIGTVSALCLYFVTGHSAAFSVAFSALLSGAMHGVNLMLISMLPAYFAPNISTASGLLNSCTYIGSAISTYGIAVIAEQAGWSTTLLVWTLLAAAGTVLCLVCTRPWQKRFIQK